MTGFEPATPRPPGVCATGLRYIPNSDCKNRKVKQITVYLFNKKLKNYFKLSIHSNKRSVQPLRCKLSLAKENPCPPVG